MEKRRCERRRKARTTTFDEGDDNGATKPTNNKCGKQNAKTQMSKNMSTTKYNMTPHKIRNQKGKLKRKSKHVEQHLKMQTKKNNENTCKSQNNLNHLELGRKHEQNMQIFKIVKKAIPPTSYSNFWKRCWRMRLQTQNGKNLNFASSNCVHQRFIVVC